MTGRGAPTIVYVTYAGVLDIQQPQSDVGSLQMRTPFYKGGHAWTSHIKPTWILNMTVIL